MIKNVFTFLIGVLFLLTTSGEKTCTDIWTMDNNINGISLYKVSLHMCTEGMMVPSIITDSSPSVMIDDLDTIIQNITNQTNKTIIQNITNIINNATNLNITLNTSDIIYTTPSSTFVPSSFSPSPRFTPSSFSPSPRFTPSSFSPSPLNNIPSPDKSTTPSTYISKNPIANNQLKSNKTKENLNNETNNSETIILQNPGMEPVHIVLLSVGSTILLVILSVIVYIIVKKKHNCKNKICSEEDTEKEQPVATTLYKKKEITPPTQNNENKNNIKLTVNTHKEKLKALERFKSTKKKPERRRFKGAAKKVININRFSRHLEPKYPPGMDAEKKQAPNTPPPPPVVAQQQLSKQKPREGDDLV